MRAVICVSEACVGALSCPVACDHALQAVEICIIVQRYHLFLRILSEDKKQRKTGEMTTMNDRKQNSETVNFLFSAHWSKYMNITYCAQHIATQI